MLMIINADDLGLSASVNQAIFDLLARGLVTSTTVLANAPATAEAVAESRHYKNCSFGVHLNVTQFTPLTKNTALNPILNDFGCFADSAIRSVSITARLREAIFLEWSAQIDQLRAMGLTPSHIDSHHHVHTIPGLFLVLKRLQRHFGIRKVRISKNIYPTKAPVARSLLLSKALWNAALRRYFSTITTSAFTSLDDFCIAIEDQQIRHRTVELMVHPGNPGYQKEADILSASWREGLPFRTNLISFNELVARTGI